MRTELRSKLGTVANSRVKCEPRLDVAMVYLWVGLLNPRLINCFMISFIFENIFINEKMEEFTKLGGNNKVLLKFFINRLLDLYSFR